MLSPLSKATQITELGYAISLTTYPAVSYPVFWRSLLSAETDRPVERSNGWLSVESPRRTLSEPAAALCNSGTAYGDGPLYGLYHPL